MASVPATRTQRTGNRTVVRTYLTSWGFGQDAKHMARLGYQVVSTGKTHFANHILVTYRWEGAGKPPVGDGKPVFGKNQMTANQILVCVIVMGVLTWLGLHVVLTMMPSIF